MRTPGNGHARARGLTLESILTRKLLSYFVMIRGNEIGIKSHGGVWVGAFAHEIVGTLSLSRNKDDQWVWTKAENGIFNVK